MGWWVRVEAAGEGEVAARNAQAMARALARYDGELEVRDGHYTAVFSVGPELARAPERGLARATAVFTAAAKRAEMPEWPIVAFEAVTKAEAVRRSRPSLEKELVGVAEVAEMLGVTRQRVGQLRGRLPEPLASLRSGPVWDRTAIEAFEATWERTPGRPRKTA